MDLWKGKQVPRYAKVGVDMKKSIKNHGKKEIECGEQVLRVNMQASHIEKAKVDVNLADYNVLYDFYNYILNGLKDGSIWNEYSPLVGIGKYGDRMVTFARRIDKLTDLQAPALVLQVEKCMLIDSIVLYKTNAVGDLYENKK